MRKRWIAACRGRIGTGARRGMLGVAVLGAAVAAALPAALAQPATGPAARTQADAASQPEIAAAVARVAALDLAATPGLTTDDYAIAAAILEIAHDLAPRDEEILRRLMEAHTAAGNHARELELAPRLLAIAPADTVVQLRLITGRILEHQDAEARLALYDRFLGERGAALDPAIRSRLALDAALLHRERGEERAFVHRLSTAIELDPTNKDAASLALAYYAERLADPAGRFELLITLFRADPLDSETHFAVARELAAAGAYHAAARSYMMARALRELHGSGLSPAEQAEFQVMAWQLDGAEAILRAGMEMTASQREALEARRQQALAAGAAESELPKATDVHLQLPVLKVLVVAAAALRDDDALEWAMSELELAARSTITPRPRTRDGPPVAPSDALLQQVFGDLLWMRLWAGRDIDLAIEQLESIRGEEVNPLAVARLEGWLLLRQGEFDAAEDRLRPLADRDPLALLGLAVAAEAGGDDAGAITWYADLSRREAGSAVAAYAKTRILALGGAEPAPPEHAGRLAAMAEAGIPRWAEMMIQDPRSFMSIAVEPEQTTVNGSGRIAVRLRLRNTSPIPLAVGPAAPIGSRILMTPTVEFGLSRAAGMATMEVLSIDRRLRLMPQEAMEVTFRPEMGTLWYILNQLGDRVVRLRWRALQSFRFTREGIFVPGPLALTVESALQTRQPLDLALAEPAELSEAIRTGDTARLHVALAALGWRWAAEPERSGIPAEGLEAIVAALADRYTRGTPAERTLILAMAPPANRYPALAPLDAAAREERDPAVLSLLMVTRITDAADPILAAAAGSGDERVRSLAERIADRLASGVPSFARPAAGEPGADAR